jgi:hypothetical protein
MQKNRHPLTILYGVVLLLVLGAVLAHNLESYMDILFWDESNYMVGGLRLWARFNRAWGPSYTVWYKMLSYVQPDSLLLYYINYKLTSVLTPILSFLFMIGIGISVEISFLLSCGFLFSTFNMPVWPHVSHFCLILFFTAGIINSYLKDGAIKWAIWVVTFYILSNTRPEYYLSFCLIFVVWFLYILYTKTFKKIYVAPVLLFVAAGHYVIGIPLMQGKVDRSGMAFTQHLAKNHYDKLGLTDKNFWLHWPDYYKEVFGNDSLSFTQALLSKPQLVLGHICTNFLHYFKEMGRLLLEVFTINDNLPLFFSIVKVVVILVLLFVIYGHTKSLDKAKSWQIKQHSFLASLLMLLPLPISILLIYPREHYLILQLPLVFCIISLWFTGRTSHSYLMTGIIIFSIFVFSLIGSPKAKDFVYFDLYRNKPHEMRNYHAVQYIRKLNIQDSIKVIDNEGYFNNFLRPFKDRGWGGYEAKSDFYTFMKQKKINLLYVTPTLVEDKYLSKDSNFVHLMEKPEDFGFYRQSFGNYDAYFLINKELAAPK